VLWLLSALSLHGAVMSRCFVLARTARKPFASAGATAATVVLLGAATLAPAHAAATPETADLAHRLESVMQAVQAQQRTLEQQAELLKAQAAEIERLKNELGRQQSAAQAAQESPTVAMTGARPTVTSADGRFTFTPRAIVHVDAAHHDQAAAGPLATDFRRGSVGGAGNRETDAARDLSDGAYFRRARLGFEGTIDRDFAYRFVMELGGAGTEGPARVNDAWISYGGFAPFTLQLGAFSPPANMDDSTGVDNLAFLERATAAELSRQLAGADGRFGLGARANGQRWMGALTLTTRTLGDAEVFDSQLGAVGRVAFLAATGEDYTLHLGASGTYVFRPPDQGPGATGARHPIRFRDRPEIRVDSTRLIDTGPIDADSAWASGVELGAQWRNLYLQAENFWFGVHRSAAAAPADPAFGGWYVQGSWFLTGESRRYSMANGSYSAPRPRVPFTATGGTGAWELALRYSTMDLDFATGAPGTLAPASAVRGGTQRIWTLGLNWYANANVRFMLNWLRVDVDRLNPLGPALATPFGAGAATPPAGVQIGQSLDVIALRSQFSF